MFNHLKKAAAVFAAAAVLSVPAADMFAVNISSADLQRPQGRYFNEALYEAGGQRYLESRDKWVEFIDTYTLYGYYKGTPFSTGLYAASPYGDRWQFDTDAHAQLVTKDGGSAAEGCMTSTGFVWHALSASLSLNGGIGFTDASAWVPNVNYFNDQGFSRSSWRGANGGRWYNFLTDYNVCYYEFRTKEEMLSSGKLHKGDIIWTIDGAAGACMAGLSVPADNHHVGIYTGDGRSDLWWQSGPTQGNGIFTDARNSVNPIYGCAVNNTYVVIPFARESGQQPVQTTVPATAPATAPVTAPVTTAPAVPPATAPVTAPVTAPPATSPETTPAATTQTAASIPVLPSTTAATEAVQHATIPPFTAPHHEGWDSPVAGPTRPAAGTPAPSWGEGGVVVVATTAPAYTPVQTGIQGWGPGGTAYVHTAPPATTTTAAPVTTTTEAPVTTLTEPPVTTVTEAPATTVTEAPVTTVSELPATTVTEAPVTTITEAPVTTVTQAPVTTVTEAPVTSATSVTTTAPVTTAAYKYGDMKNEDGVYFNEALKAAGNNSAAVSPAQWQSFLNEYSLTEYYTGTPYSLSIYSASPKGDNWQYKEFSSPADYGITADNGGMESMGFVWHALANAISKNTGTSIAAAGQSVPLLGSFNDLKLSRLCWNDSGWYNFICKYKVHYYEFADKASMLSSGKLHKGDIIWTVDSQGGIGYSGLLNIASHHVGIYMGSGSSDLWWSTGPTKGNGDFSEIKNSISPIYGMAQNNSYLVIPFARIDSSYVEPPAPAGKAGDISGDGLVDSADASLILDDYAKASTSGTHLLTADQLKLSDVNGDGMTDSTDASAILDYYSYTSTGGTKTITEYLSQH